MDKADDPTAEFAFHAGAELALSGPFKMCIDDVELTDPAFTRAAAGTGEDAAAPRLLVNQLGYLPDLPSWRRCAPTQPRSSRVGAPDRRRHPSAAGRWVVRRRRRFGRRVHVSICPSRRPEGSTRCSSARVRATLSDIAPDLYRRPKYDALAYFYQNRSGIAISMPYAGNPRGPVPRGTKGTRVCRVRLARDARIRSTFAAVGTTPATTANTWSTGASPSGRCSICTRGPRSAARRSPTSATASSPFPRATTGAPTCSTKRAGSSNFLRMQIPEGAPHAGMAHHKIHDKEWTELGTAPHEDKMQRFLYPPTTAATLNLAAAAAQASRLSNTMVEGAT